jgi:hypothetical protein
MNYMYYIALLHRTCHSHSRSMRGSWVAPLLLLMVMSSRCRHGAEAFVQSVGRLGLGRRRGAAGLAAKGGGGEGRKQQQQQQQKKK